MYKPLAFKVSEKVDPLWQNHYFEQDIFVLILFLPFCLMDKGKLKTNIMFEMITNKKCMVSKQSQNSGKLISLQYLKG